MSPVPIVRPSLILRHALKAKAVIAPAENSKKTPAGVLEQLRKELETIGVEFESPKPFCALEKTGKPIIDSFVDLGFGKPVLRIETSHDGKMFIGAGVIRDAPCSTSLTGSENHLASFRFQNTFLLNV